jgi:hypothetical protein
MGAESAIRARFVRPWFTIEIGCCRFQRLIKRPKPAYTRASVANGIAMLLWLSSRCDTDTVFDAPAGARAGGGFHAYLV